MTKHSLRACTGDEIWTYGHHNAKTDILRDPRKHISQDECQRHVDYFL